MKKSREFNNILDECLERLLVKDETLAQCLQSFPEQADELKPLLETALATKKASDIQPRPEFRDRARYQFLSALQEMETKRRHHFFGWNWQARWVAIVATVLALLLASGGTVAAAGSSMPDEPLYPLKLATEQVRLVFTPSALGKAELYADLADRRVAEIVHLADKNKPEHIERTARHLDTYLTRIADLASTQPITGGVAMAPSAKEAPLLAEGAEGVEGADIRGDRRAKLRTTVRRHAINHPARLRALLKTVPPSARSALLRAIDLSETGYEKASKSLDQP